jgi:hypothetical protein
MAALMLLGGRLIALLEPANMSTKERLDRLLRRDDNRRNGSSNGPPGRPWT